MFARGKGVSWPDWVKPGALFRPKAWTERDQFLGMILEVQDWDNYHGALCHAFCISG